MSKQDPFNYGLKITPEDINFYSNIMSSWKKLNGKLNDLTETALKKAFLVECSTTGRLPMLKRIKSRINILVVRRELSELIKGFEKPQS